MRTGVIIHTAVRLAVGAVFCLSGFGKLVNVSVFQQLIISYGLPWASVLAPLIVIAEVAVGMLLLLHVGTRRVARVAGIMLVVFTVVYVYGWFVHGVEDCGCFGMFEALNLPPVLSLGRNLLLIAACLWLQLAPDEVSRPGRGRLLLLMAVMYLTVFAAGLTFRPRLGLSDRHPWVGQPVAQTPLASCAASVRASSLPDTCLFFFFTYECPHCINSMENFRAWQRSLPPGAAAAYAVCPSGCDAADAGRSAEVFRQRYPDIPASEVLQEAHAWLTAYPTAFIVRHDTVSEVIIGELPSPYLYFGQQTPDAGEAQ